MKKLTLGFLVLSAVFILVNSSRIHSATDLKPTMYQFASEIMALKPYIIEPKKFFDQKNEDEIKAHLKRLNKLVDQASHKKALKKPDYQETIIALKKHLNRTEKNFREGHKEISRYMVQSAVHTCITCHTRLPVGLSSMKGMTWDDKKGRRSFNEAEFLFATRSFSQALESFEYLILNYPKNSLSLNQLLSALDYSASIYARLLRDPKQAVVFFEKVERSKKLPLFVKDDIRNWRKAFEKWAEEEPLAAKNMTEKATIHEAQRILSSSLANPFFVQDRSNHIAYLRASGLLHEFIQKWPQSKWLPDAYYLLGVSYLSLDHDFFMGFDHMYLKNCIKKYGHYPIARQCYNLLEESIYLGYSGSSGTNVPLDVMKELTRYRKFIR